MKCHFRELCLKIHSFKIYIIKLRLIEIFSLKTCFLHISMMMYLIATWLIAFLYAFTYFPISLIKYILKKMKVKAIYTFRKIILQTNMKKFIPIQFLSSFCLPYFIIYLDIFFQTVFKSNLS